MPPVTTRELLRLALPSVAFAILTQGFRVVDQYFIQNAGTAAQAAVGSSVFVVIVWFGAFWLVAGGASPLVARATGAADPKLRREVLGQALALAVALGLGMSAVGVVGAEALSAALGLTGDTAEACTIYLRTLSWTLLPLALTPLVDQAFIAMGSARVPALLQGVSLALNIALTPLFIGWWGVAGAALASNLSRGVTTVVAGAVLWRQAGLTRADVRFGPQVRRIVRLGMPITVGTVAYALVYWAMLYTTISPLGPHVNAALGIGFAALESVSWPAFNGLSMAVASFTGRALGAGAPERAWEAVRRSLPWSTGLGLGFGLLFWFGGPYLTGLFTDDPAVHEAATTYARILAFSQLFVAWEALGEGVLSGAGATRAVFWISTPFNLLRIPLAWALAWPFGWGAAGVWWAINLTSLGKALVKGEVVRRGGWSRLEIDG